MGGLRKYNPEGGFSEYLYHQVGDSVTANGITAKVVTKIGDEDFHSALPSFSNTSNAYAKRSDEGEHEVEQLRIYVNRKASIDFDWGHAHGNCVKGVVHVHIAAESGNFHRHKKQVRYMNDEEIAMYGPLIKALNPNAKFRP